MEERIEAGVNRVEEGRERKLACVASVSVRFRSRERGTRVKHRAKNGASKERGGGGSRFISREVNRPFQILLRKS